MTREQAITYFKTQSYAIELLVKELEGDKKVTVEWMIDLVGVNDILKEVDAL
ncbi:hypothetical protein [Paenibacillus qinlingensis]|uniref:Uncharacterized protein n=1 Tax=Paenibacillus qinlingensis TaxID=1837343 RepID=A0ABU1P7E8_9BACL|nr:hypothetical protein [Paenibacillus qinlingensis]MDR6555484.1 hypothetical protein [Paenibacillus qinlingensis]